MMGGQMFDQHVLVSEPFPAQFTLKSRLLVALKLHVSPQIVEVLVAGDALVTAETSVLRQTVPGQI